MGWDEFLRNALADRARARLDMQTPEGRVAAFQFLLPAIQKMHEKYGGAGLEVATIALDGEPLKTSIAGFIKQEGYTFRVLIDELDPKEMFKVADPYGVAGTPTLYLLDREGKVAFARAGRLTEEEVEKAIQAVLKK